MHPEEKALKVAKLGIRCAALEQDLQKREHTLIHRAEYDRVVAQELCEIWGTIDQAIDVAASQWHGQSHADVWRGIEHWLYELLTTLSARTPGRNSEEKSG